MKKMIIVIITIIVIIATFKAMEERKRDEIQKTETTEVAENTVGILSSEYNKYYIEVLVRNNKNVELQTLTVTAHCYDKDGNNLGDKKDYEVNVRPKETYKMRIYAGTEVKKYNLDVEYIEKK